ncbi:DNA (cytosine-5-)-methyltransferase [Babesia caballi]|uniref:DNA (Cytosine-5-)-methyltransferase n=1 Tax=Babesia caballi TaxID=5871 RepID=A0AAV4LX64_BABCB|nr:DNA (cytosine-5-)-methyltransferase [Babesia caballi]
MTRARRMHVVEPAGVIFPPVLDFDAVRRQVVVGTVLPMQLQLRFKPVNRVRNALERALQLLRSLQRVYLLLLALLHLAVEVLNVPDSALDVVHQRVDRAFCRQQRLATVQVHLVDRSQEVLVPGVLGELRSFARFHDRPEPIAVRCKAPNAVVDLPRLIGVFRVRAQQLKLDEPHHLVVHLVHRGLQRVGADLRRHLPVLVILSDQYVVRQRRRLPFYFDPAHLVVLLQVDHELDLLRYRLQCEPLARPVGLQVPVQRALCVTLRVVFARQAA